MQLVFLSIFHTNLVIATYNFLWADCHRGMRTSQLAAQHEPVRNSWIVRFVGRPKLCHEGSWTLAASLAEVHHSVLFPFGTHQCPNQYIHLDTLGGLSCDGLTISKCDPRWSTRSCYVVPFVFGRCWRQNLADSLCMSGLSSPCACGLFAGMVWPRQQLQEMRRLPSATHLQLQKRIAVQKKIVFPNFLRKIFKLDYTFQSGFKQPTRKPALHCRLWRPRAKGSLFSRGPL